MLSVVEFRWKILCFIMVSGPSDNGCTSALMICGSVETDQTDNITIQTDFASVETVA